MEQANIPYLLRCLRWDLGAPKRRKARLRIIYCPREDDFGRILKILKWSGQREVSGLYSMGLKAVFVTGRLDLNRIGNLARRLCHESCHAYLSMLYGKEARNKWLREGYAYMMEDRVVVSWGTAQPQLRSSCKLFWSLHEAGRTFSVTEILSVKDDTEEILVDRWTLFSAQSLLLLDYLMSMTRERPALRHALREIHANDNIDGEGALQMIEGASGLSLAGLEAGYARHCERLKEKFNIASDAS
jgi:hypothetical protein